MVLVEAAQPDRRIKRHRYRPGEERAEVAVEELRSRGKHERHAITGPYAERLQPTAGVTRPLENLGPGEPGRALVAGDEAQAAFRDVGRAFQLVNQRGWQGGWPVPQVSSGWRMPGPWP